MKPGSRWIILDTETDGLTDPIHVVEVAAQLMDGWEPQGVPFRVLINHGIDIDYEATQIHGYDRAFLEKHGIDPLRAYSAMREYVKDYPIVAHNLGYDWDRALTREWERLGVPQIGRRGFCSLALSRRVIPEAESHKLEALKNAFGLNVGRSHQALGDVTTLVQLMTSVIAPRLSRASLETFDLIERFSRKDTKACHEVIITVQSGRTLVPRPAREAQKKRKEPPNDEPKVDKQPVERVYHIARPGKTVGQFHIDGLFKGLRSGLLSYDDLYWTAGMAQSWIKLRELKDLIEQSAPKMASERQAVYLSWLGIPNAHQLTAEEASHLIDTRGGNRGYAPEGKIWSTERFILHPELFREEYSKHLSGKVMRACIDYYHEQYFECSEPLDRLIAMDVINTLQPIDSSWWNKDSFGEVFVQVLKSKWPACCDGKSVFYYQKLPKLLSQSVRTKVVNATGTLSKEKVQAVMDSLANLDRNWHEKTDFKERFFDALRLRFPECCDGESAELKRDTSKKRLEDETEQARRDIVLLFPLAASGDVLVQYKLGMAMYALGKNSSRDYNVASENLNGAFEWLTKSAMAGNQDAQLALAFFASKKIIGFAPIAEVNAWLRICYHSGRYKSQFEVINGRTKYVEHPVAKKILAEIERISWRYDEQTRLKSDVLFGELCAHFGFNSPG